MLQDQTQNKVSKPYSLDPVVVAWVSQKALRLGSENGERVSDSKLVNDILTREMELDKRITELKTRVVTPTQNKIKAVTK